MAVKFRYVDVLTGTSHVGAGAVSGEARATLGLGATHGKVAALEIKGDDTNVDQNAQIDIVDAAGRKIVGGITLDAGTTTFDEYTAQSGPEGTINGTASTVGYLIRIDYPEDQFYDAEGDAAADTEGISGGGVYAKSPLTVTLTSGTDGDYHRLGVWVEV